MAIRWEPKRPDEVRDYEHDWTPFLGDDTIATQDTTATGVTLDSVAIEAGNRAVKFWVSGGTDGTAHITQTITTAGGRTETEVFILPVRAAEEPVSLATAKAQCRVLDDSEDNLIAAYIVAAREWVENYTGHILVRREISQSFNGFSPYFELFHRPIVDVTGIAYADTAGTDQVLDGFAQTTGRYPFRVYPDEQPSVRSNSSVVVTYVAGYAEGEQPQSLIQAMLLLIGHWFANRQGVVVGDTATEVPLAVHSLCDQHRSPLL